MTLRNMTLSVGLIATAVVVYWPSSLALWGFWTDDNHSGAHGPLVVALAAWLLFRARYRLAAVRVHPSLPAGGLLVLCSVAWLVFWRAGIQELHILLLPVLMGLGVFTALGFGAALQVALPLGYLYFAVPAWGIFIEPLQELTIRAVGVLAPLIGVPAQVHGDLVQLPGVGTFEIAGGCGGVNFLTVGLAVAVLLGEVERASLARRALLLGVMGILAIVSNWIRVLTVIQAGYTTNMRHVLVSRGHYMFGWVLFTVVMVGFVWFFMRRQARQAGATGSGAGAAPAASPPAYAVPFCALVAMPLIVYAVAAAFDPGVMPVAFTAPAGRAGWQGPVSAVGDGWKPDFVGPHSQWSFVYQGPPGRRVEMVAIGYASQAQGRELVSSENSLLGVTGRASMAEDTVRLGDGAYMETVAADDQGHRSVVWSIYDIGGREFVTPLWSQLWYGVRSLGGPPYSVLFAFRAACDASCDTARDTLEEFCTDHGRRDIRFRDPGASSHSRVAIDMTYNNLFNGLRASCGAWIAAMLLVPACVLAQGTPATAPGASSVAPVSQPATVDPNSYVIGPGDTLQVFVWRNPELTATVPVRPDGKISTPLNEDMVAVGKTPGQLARDVEKQLATFVRSPTVNIIVTVPMGANSQIQVIGQVTKPGAVPYRAGMKVLDAVLAVGGLHSSPPGIAPRSFEWGTAGRSKSRLSSRRS